MCQAGEKKGKGKSLTFMKSLIGRGVFLSCSAVSRRTGAGVCMMEMFKTWPFRDEMLSHCFVFGLSGESVCPGSHESVLSLQSSKAPCACPILTGQLDETGTTTEKVL